MRAARIPHGAFTRPGPTPSPILRTGATHARHSPAGAGRRPVRPDGGLRGGLRAGVTAVAELVLGGVVTAGLLLYLLWALLRPEGL
ncbi:potassium-transporting ATPase subunit F [Falsiroseomonas sp. HW251]|uniref:potassium-transporting ATPase subunit F n=1 Tax=Falsiroseomonas sp. HW251 TaxID=3390998 RepID=UPI003D31E599